MSSLSPKMVANNLWEDCETMKRPAESTSIGDSDVTQRSCSSERSLRNFEPDGEDFFLLMKGKQRIRNGSWRSAWSWSTRVYISVTVVNIVLFSISILVLWTSHGVRNLSEQDHWRATSYYCISFLPSSVIYRTADTYRSPSLRPLHHPQTHNRHEWHLLGH
jgi:hypothetical protein